MDVHWICTNLCMHKQIFVCFFSFVAMFPCWTYFVRLAGSSRVMKNLHLILMWKPPHPPTTTTKVLLSTVYIKFSTTFPFLFDAYRHFISYLCYINWYAKINTLNACNHLATSYSHIPKTCAFDCYTNNISTFLEQCCLWSKHFFSQCSDTIAKIHASFWFLFRNLEQPTLHMQTHIWKV